MHLSWSKRASYSKLNLFLEVVDRRADGYHNIESVFVEIDLCDHLYGEKIGANSITLLCDDPDLPTDGRNLIVRAVETLRIHTGTYRKGLQLRLGKAIPQGAGLGGGSSNAAAALSLANELWECGLDREQLQAIASSVGADVPFFLQGGACLCQGKGERITLLPHFPGDIAFGLALPGIHCATGEAYSNLPLPSQGEIRSSRRFVEAMQCGDIRAMEANAFNRFEESVFTAVPRLREIHAGLRDRVGVPVRMTGSGSGLWFFVRDGWKENTDLREWATVNRVLLLQARAVSPSNR